MAKNQGGQGNFNHFGAVRLRVTGSGNLKMTFLGLDSIEIVALADLPMTLTNRLESLRLTNFTQQRAQLEFKTTEVDETFVISKVSIFIKPVATEVPA